MSSTHVPILVNKSLPSKHLACVAILFWLIASLGGAHGHFCFDGKEPPISAHMDVLGGHIEHVENEEHHDLDVDLTSSLAVKYFKVDLPLLAMLALIVVACGSPQKLLHPAYRSFSLQRLPGLRPPLRAPPVLFQSDF